MNTLRPAQPIKPGEILQEELEARNWTQADFAAIVGRPVQAINEIVVGKKAITTDTAIAFSLALETSPEYWMNLETAYRLDLSRAEDSRAKSKTSDIIPLRAKLYSKLPIKELLKLRWISVSDDKDVARLEAAVCKFLEIESIDDTPKGFAARKTHRESEHSKEQLAWVCQARKIARKQKVNVFHADALQNALQILPRLSQHDDSTKTVKKRLADLGIRFVILPHLPGTKIDGAALWLDDESPVIVLSLRYDRVDAFWFTLMHELCHVERGDAREEVCIDDNLVGKDAVRHQSDAERKADDMASNYLIPEAVFDTFVKLNKPYFSRSVVQRFAQELNIHPAIVVGRLQHKGHIPWTHLRNVLTGVRHLFAGDT